MSKINTLITRLCALPKDFTWDELLKVLTAYGYKQHKNKKTGGSRRKFSNDEGQVIELHEPHPSKILKTYQIKDVIEKLNLRPAAS